jgi:hypothetical protein
MPLLCRCGCHGVSTVVVAVMVLVSFLDVELNGVEGMDNGVSLHAGHTHTHR